MDALDEEIDCVDEDCAEEEEVEVAITLDSEDDGME